MPAANGGQTVSFSEVAEGYTGYTSRSAHERMSCCTTMESIWINFNLLDCNVHVQTLFLLRFPRLGSFAQNDGFVCAKCESRFGSLTRCLGSFGQNVLARVRSADLPVERNHSPQAEVWVGRVGTDLFMVCSYRSRHNKASRFHKIEEPLPNAPQRRSPHERSEMRANRPGCRFAHPGYKNWCGC